jgi:hypothetical protein
VHGKDVRHTRLEDAELALRAKAAEFAAAAAQGGEPAPPGNLTAPPR